jgi:pimeloyl-ACP methyl ester carboxylesterase
VNGPDLAPRLEGAIELADGRSIGYAEYGAPNGRGVLWLHGTPRARRQVPPKLRAQAAAREVRIVALERPGIGASSAHSYANFRAWAADVGEIADGLGFERFGCIALSGGGPYLLACAHAFPERMTAGVVLGGVAPARGPEAIKGGVVGQFRNIGPFVEALRWPLGKAAWALVRIARPIASPAFEIYARFSPPGDRELFAKPGFKAMFIDDLTRGARRQFDAPILDLVLFSRSWGFSVADIKVPLAFWHGDADHIVPLAHARHLVSLVPGASLRIRSGESHMGALDAGDEILDTLLALWDMEQKQDSPAGEVARRTIGRADLGPAGA